MAQASIRDPRPDTAQQEWLHLSQNKKNKSLVSHMLIHPAPKQRGRLDLPPLSSTARSSSCRAVPFPSSPGCATRSGSMHRSSASQLPAPLAPSLPIRRPLPPSGAPLTPPWPLGHTCRGASGFPGRAKDTYKRGGDGDGGARATSRCRIPPRRPESTKPQPSPMF
jgi:hypothetical protein